MQMNTDKQQLRIKMKQQLSSQSRDNREAASKEIAVRLFDSDEFKQAKIIMFYAGTDSEVNTEGMIKRALSAGKTIVLPVAKEEDKKLIASQIIDFDKELKLGPYGILEPEEEYVREIDKEKIELVIVPGLAFDRTGRRLGRGKGYYDRFLSSLPSKTPKIGLAFNFQIVERIPCEPHDFPLTSVIST